MHTDPDRRPQVIQTPNPPKPTIVSDELAEQDRGRIASDAQEAQRKMNAMRSDQRPLTRAMVEVLGRLGAKPADYATMFDAIDEARGSPRSL